MTELGTWLSQQPPEKRLHILRHQPSYFAKGAQAKRLVAWLTDFGFLEQKLDAVGVTALIDDYDLALPLPLLSDSEQRASLKLILDLLRHQPSYFTKGAQATRLVALLKDFGFFKQNAVEITALIDDLALPLLSDSEQRALKLIQGALRLSSHILAEDKSQLAPQLLGRLLSFPEPEIRAFLEHIKQSQHKPWFRPLFPCLDSPGGALLRTFVGHRRSVNAVAITPDGKLAVSGSWDNTLKLWDLETGQEIHTCAGHSSSVDAVAITPDGSRAISGSRDETLKLWDLDTGREIRTFTGHGDWVNAVAITPDGSKAISGSKDNILKLWDLELSRKICTFKTSCISLKNSLLN